MSANEQSTGIPEEAFSDEDSVSNMWSAETAPTEPLQDGAGKTLPTEPLPSGTSTTGLPPGGALPTEPTPTGISATVPYPTRPLPPEPSASPTRVTETLPGAARTTAVPPDTAVGSPTPASTTPNGTGTIGAETNGAQVIHAERPRIRLASLFVGMIFVAVGLAARFVLPNPEVRNTFTDWIEQLRRGDWVIAGVLILGLIAIIGALSAASRGRSRRRW